MNCVCSLLFQFSNRSCAPPGAGARGWCRRCRRRGRRCGPGPRSRPCAPLPGAARRAPGTAASPRCWRRTPCARRRTPPRRAPSLSSYARPHPAAAASAEVRREHAPRTHRRRRTCTPARRPGPADDASSACRPAPLAGRSTAPRRLLLPGGCAACMCACVCASASARARGTKAEVRVLKWAARGAPLSRGGPARGRARRGVANRLVTEARKIYEGHVARRRSSCGCCACGSHGEREEEGVSSGVVYAI